MIFSASGWRSGRSVRERLVAGERAVVQSRAQADGLAWPTLQAVTVAASAFLDPVLAGVVGVWNPATGVWEVG